MRGQEENDKYPCFLLLMYFRFRKFSSLGVFYDARHIDIRRNYILPNQLHRHKLDRYPTAYNLNRV
jgi:hypothetical protein